jgi:Sigma-70, region 4
MSGNYRDDDRSIHTVAALAEDGAADDLFTGKGAGEDEAAEARDEARQAAGPADAEADDAEADAEEVDAEEVDAEADADDGPPEHSRKVRRRRRTRPRSKTIAMKRLTREELRIGALLYPPVDIPRPKTRAECRQDVGQDSRPCPWVACKHHLYLDVNPETGSIKINFPDLEPWELKHTCALDVAERGGITLEEVGEIMNLTRERIRQVEVRGLLKLKMASPSPEELGADLLRPRDDLD